MTSRSTRDPVSFDALPPPDDDDDEAHPATARTRRAALARHIFDLFIQ